MTRTRKVSKKTYLRNYRRPNCFVGTLIYSKRIINDINQKAEAMWEWASLVLRSVNHRIPDSTKQQAYILFIKDCRGIFLWLLE
ncbi:hypothetical protein PITC_034460 [Penicillium italicum]|uniref:Uncharacterized protein n=1 Tax=Penicillium italicum TaxID=40296 RepID=A0A0A2LPI2_PENIT|nr:hypothetical protein PITC_034460 [Penicillium italicum]